MRPDIELQQARNLSGLGIHLDKVLQQLLPAVWLIHEGSTDWRFGAYRLLLFILGLYQPDQECSVMRGWPQTN
jgi:hypothetical protein